MKQITLLLLTLMIFFTSCEKEVIIAAEEKISIQQRSLTLKQGPCLETTFGSPVTTINGTNLGMTNQTVSISWQSTSPSKKSISFRHESGYFGYTNIIGKSGTVSFTFTAQSSHTGIEITSYTTPYTNDEQMQLKICLQVSSGY